MIRQIPQYILKAFSSIKMAVVVILSLAVIASVGTVYESKYDAQYAQKIIYQSWAMYFVMGLLCTNLIAVMVSRWPWRRQHTGFILAHIGILLLLLGAYLTSEWGLDGSMAFQIGDTRSGVTVTTQEMSVYASFDGSSYQRLAYSQVDFLKHPVGTKPFVLDIGSNPLEVIRYVHFAARESEITASDRAGDGPALRILLQNNFVNQTEWLRRDLRQPRTVKEFGPAQVVLTDGSPYEVQNHNVVVFAPGSKPDRLRFVVYKKDRGVTGHGEVGEGGKIQTEWAGMTLRLLRVLEHAREDVQYIDVGHPNNLTTPAIQIRYLGETHWLGLNSQLRLFTEQTAYQINYNNSQAELPFALTLNGFHVGRYPGTQRAASYESDVLVNNQQRVTISMNNPLKYAGFTFYQASFEEDPTGRPTMSVLSVNRDPGRVLKYLGSFLIVLGSLVLFYFKNKFRRRLS